MTTIIEDNSVVLFQGDSITDCDRRRENPNHLGSGYAMMAAAWFSAIYPEKKVGFLNRGIGGNKIKDLQDRWQVDCLDLRPTWVSILIGINNTWWRYEGEGRTMTSPEDFEKGYRNILERTKEKLNTKFILCEPFVLEISEDRMKWREDLNPKIDVVRKLAREFGALLVPLDGVFAQASTLREPRYWAEDGVHPSPAGHFLMAQAWLRSVRAI
jgi:lysophospholipase L1-like esterase